jgi:hypothetical protein
MQKTDHVSNQVKLMIGSDKEDEYKNFMQRNKAVGFTVPALVLALRSYRKQQGCSCGS